MATILLIDDDRSLLDVLALSFEDEGYDVLCAYDGEQGWLQFRNESPDLIISDVNMPKLDGFSLCRRLRDEGYDLPVILLTSRDNEIDEALGLELGADDYVAKPFSTRVLTARVKALLRREAARAGGKTADKPKIVESNGLRLDPERLEVLFKGTEVTVTVTEFRMLEAFAARPGIVLSRNRLMELVRGDDSIVADRIIDTYVRRLRRKLEQIDDGFALIETVIGAGYRWKKV
jgi:DNA-binding response OmpR family regulator